MLAVVRIRGNAGLRKEVKDTLKMLRLKAPNNCVIVPETESYKGMLQKCKDVCTWGEIEKEVLVKLLQKRLRMEGDRRVDEKILKEITNFSTFEEFAEALISGKVKLKDFKKLKPVFRLTPPSKGFKSVKEHWPKGDLGYRGKEINELLERMI
ncbi:MAG: 50S ribosomal protein L30 [Candidatus Aenigmatarchaeota archaeon]